VVGHCRSDLVPPPVVDARLPGRARDLVDGLVLVERVVVEVCRGDLLEDRARLRPEGVPHALLDERDVARIERARAALQVEMEYAPEDLEALLLALVVVQRVPLAGRLDDELLAVLAVDAVDDGRLPLREARDT